jgi:hypothetical protein
MCDRFTDLPEKWQTRPEHRLLRRSHEMAAVLRQGSRLVQQWHYNILARNGIPVTADQDSITADLGNYKNRNMVITCK